MDESKTVVISPEEALRKQLQLLSKCSEENAYTPLALISLSKAIANVTSWLNHNLTAEELVPEDRAALQKQIKLLLTSADENKCNHLFLIGITEAMLSLYNSIICV